MFASAPRPPPPKEIQFLDLPCGVYKHFILVLLIAYFLLAAAKKTGRLSLVLPKLLAKLRGRPWEPPPQSAASSSSIISPKLVMKILLVAGIAAGWQYYFG